MADDFAPQPIILGILGLDLKRAIDKVPPEKLARSQNLLRREDGGITARPGQTLLVTATGAPAAEMHSIARLNKNVRLGATAAYDPTDFIRVAGIGEAIYAGKATLDLVESGFSGNPLLMVPYRPPLSSSPYLFIGDSSKMRKVSVGSLSLPIGLAIPPGQDGRFRLDEFAKTPDSAISNRDRTRFTSFGFDLVDSGAGEFLAYGTLYSTTIDDFEAAAGWNNNAGSGGVPANALDAAIFKVGAGSMKFTSAKGAAVAAYYNFWSKAVALELNKLSGGLRGATDDDHIHMWMRLDRPDKISEIRIYFVCSSVFNTATVPGTDATNNTEAYVKSIRVADIQGFFEISATALAAGSSANTSDAITQTLKATKDTRSSTQNVREQRDRKRLAAKEASPGRGAWTEFGNIGVPLRRGEFQRIGSDTTRSWANVTGIIVVLVTTDATTGLQLWLDDFFLTGGSGLDSSDIGAIPYDYRYRNYDPRTGAKGNPSPEQGPAYRLDSLRRSIIGHPVTYGDSAIRQQFFRRGGTLTNNWYFVGVNGSDGGLFEDTVSDASIVNAETLDIDNDQPVTTVDEEGNAILAQPLQAIWGPVEDLLFGCGDPYRPGYLYWCKPGEPDHWPAANTTEACPPSEALQSGCVYNGQSYAFSLERGFAVLPNLAVAGQVKVIPNGCEHGFLTPWAFCVGPAGIIFCSKDGVYTTTGGQETNITDQDLKGLFMGETRNGYLPIDLSTEAGRNAIRLTYHGNDVWFEYRDSGGTNRVLVYNIFEKYWRWYSFGVPIAGIYYEEGAPELSLLMGARSGGGLYQLSGTSDAGAPIAASGRTGALDQGNPRAQKKYGDLAIDLDARGINVTLTALVNVEATTLPGIVVTGSGRARQNVALFGSGAGLSTGPQEAYNFSLDFSWSTALTPPTIYQVLPSFLVLPDTTSKRVTDWDDLGRATDKFIKGIKLEVDTGGLTKTVEIQADQLTKKTISVSSTGRTLLMFTWQEFLGRLLRLNPTDANNWTVYNYSWIWDDEPLSLDYWETQLVDHGVAGWHTPLYSFIALTCAADVTLTISEYDQQGSVVATAYTITNTGGNKVKRFVPYRQKRGVFYKYLFTSSSQFRLYREESFTQIQPWGAGASYPTRPFGNDDVDGTRSMAGTGVRDAYISARRGGGGF